MSFKRIGILLAGCGALAACNTANTHIGDIDPAIGEALKYDMAIQTIHPAPVYAADAAQPGDSGERGAAAVKRYRSGAVKQPEAQRTSTGGGGGGGGGGSL
jgi:predicted small secreted protein